jgi:hypothetical protein
MTPNLQESAEAEAAPKRVTSARALPIPKSVFLFICFDLNNF